MGEPLQNSIISFWARLRASICYVHTILTCRKTIQKQEVSDHCGNQEKLNSLYEIDHDHICQLYRFAEFGKYSAGLFHDLVNPLTAISLAVKNLHSTHKTNEFIDIAMVSVKQMESYINSIKKHLRPSEALGLFSVITEIQNACNILNFQARKQRILLKCTHPEELTIPGNSLKFNQVICNLLANALDAYRPFEQDKDPRRRIVKLQTHLQKNNLILTVKDRGIGIKKELREKLFQPFFTTKPHGIGLGLVTTKDIVEKHFGGSIKLASHPGSGTTFTVTIPL